MKTASIVLFSLFLWGCNSPEETVTPAPVAEVAPVITDTLKNLPEPKDTGLVVLFGRGIEPGWLCEFYANRIRFVFDHGKDSLIVRGLNFTFQLQNPKYFNDIKIESRNKDTSFATMPGPCKEESTGDMKPLKMVIKMGKKEFNGCAWTPK
jgi:hypothetical protein